MLALAVCRQLNKKTNKGEALWWAAGHHKIPSVNSLNTFAESQNFNEIQTTTVNLFVKTSRDIRNLVKNIL